MAVVYSTLFLACAMIPNTLMKEKDDKPFVFNTTILIFKSLVL
jgi:hypothetical protein